jgi:catechol 2,3-dioxygenase-like lactoylglutathione lyase family enzyme
MHTGCSMKRLLLVLSFAVLYFASPAQAQLAPPNEAGVTMGQVQFIVQDVDAARDFWTKLGGQVGKLQGAPLEYAKFPGVVIFWRKGEPAGAAAESIVNHIGFYVPDVPAVFAKWKADGVKIEQGNNPKQGYAITPDGLVRIEIMENASLTTPIAFDHIHFRVQDTGAGGMTTMAAMQAWYVKLTGGKAIKRNIFDATSVPGVTMLFGKGDVASEPTKGRGLDHIGFEVKNLEAFCKKAEADGFKFDTPCRKSPTGIWVATLTDPWGTRIELNEGLAGL